MANKKHWLKKECRMLQQIQIPRRLARWRHQALGRSNSGSRRSSSHAVLSPAGALYHRSYLVVRSRHHLLSLHSRGGSCHQINLPWWR